MLHIISVVFYELHRMAPFDWLPDQQLVDFVAPGDFIVHRAMFILPVAYHVLSHVPMVMRRTKIYCRLLGAIKITLKRLLL